MAKESSQEDNLSNDDAGVTRHDGAPSTESAPGREYRGKRGIQPLNPQDVLLRGCHVRVQEEAEGRGHLDCGPIILHAGTD